MKSGGHSNWIIAQNGRSEPAAQLDLLHSFIDQQCTFTNHNAIAFLPGNFVFQLAPFKLQYPRQLVLLPPRNQ